MSEPLSDVRPGHIDRHPEYPGPRCEHGFPDASCLEVLKTLPDYETAYAHIAEFRAFVLASKYGSPGLLADWARPCTRCRDAMLERRYGSLEADLLALCAGLSKAAREASASVERLRGDLGLAHGLLVDIERRKDTIRAARPSEDLGYIYAVSDGTAVKIGWTFRRPVDRLKQLQTASPSKLHLIGAVLAAQYEERMLHGRFAIHRIRGEWFRHVPEIVEYFTNE